MKKFFKLMVLITALTFCFGTMTVFAADTEEYESVEGGDINMDGEGDDDDQSGDMEGDGEGDDEESSAGGTASPQTSASIAPIVAMAGIAAAGAAAGLKRK